MIISKYEHDSVAALLERVCRLKAEMELVEELAVHRALVDAGWRVQVAAKTLGWSHGKLVSALGLHQNPEARFAKLGAIVRERNAAEGYTRGRRRKLL